MMVLFSTLWVLLSVVGGVAVEAPPQEALVSSHPEKTSSQGGSPFSSVNHTMLHGDGLFDTSEIMDEVERVKQFKARHKTWPDPRWLARETSSYAAAMAEREAELMQIADAQLRWDGWMFLAQARLLEPMTTSQWQVKKAPKEVHIKLLAHLQSALLDHVQQENISTDLTGVRGPKPPDFVEQTSLNSEVHKILLPLHEEWAGIPLEPTSVYGARIYRDGATLIDHLDVPETHVISSVLHVDSDLDAPFPIEIQDADGKYSAVDLKPGDMMFYESAKAFHRRSVPMRGKYYASIFLHYRPLNWTFSRKEIRLAVPPHWNRGLVVSTSGQPTTKASDTTNAAAAAAAAGDDDDDDDDDKVVLSTPPKQHKGAAVPPEGVTEATFRVADDSASWFAAHGPVHIHWVVNAADASDDVDFGSLSPATPSLRVHTHPGHVWRALGHRHNGGATDDVELGRWTIAADSASQVFRINPAASAAGVSSSPLSSPPSESRRTSGGEL